MNLDKHFCDLCDFIEETKDRITSLMKSMNRSPIDSKKNHIMQDLMDLQSKLISLAANFEACTNKFISEWKKERKDK